MDKVAMALQWAIHSFMPGPIALTRDPNNQALQLGLGLSSDILLPLAAELGLKGLKQKETSIRDYERTHDLLRLFKSLSDGAQESLSARFRGHMSGDIKMRDRNRCLEKFLGEHRNDFTEWRYLDGNLGELHSARLEFHYAICAILDEVYSADELER
ncbi:hypothetical protein F4X86_01475 [Candidatus Saccharibacteria bacterium]|nr:hypothetical protein [Candidatus Saccharibacteria bacterium]